MKLPSLSDWRNKKSEPNRSALIAGVATGIVAVAGVAAWAYSALTATAQAAKKVVRRKKKESQAKA